MLRVVLDTSVIVAGLRSRNGASNLVLRSVATGDLTPLITTPLFLEYEDVLKRPDQRSAHGLSDRDIDRFLAALAAASLPVEIHFLWRPLLKDAKDEMVLEAAINGRADRLVTHNVRDFRPQNEHFGIRLATPGELVRELSQ